MAQDVLNCMQAGFRSFEVHVGTGIAADVARVRAIREAAGNEITVIVDVNGHWTVKEAIHAIRALQEFDVMVEQPVKGLEAMAEVRAAVEAPIVADESCHTVEDTVEIIRRKAADVLCVKPIKAGGLTKARRICNLADAFGLKVRIDGLPGETLVSNTASAHLTVTLRNTVADGVMQHWRLAEDVVESGGLIFEDAKVRVTDDPGLGLSERSGVAQVVETFTAD
ncbi:MAG: hypothetical protein HYY09_08585 [Firmicutes bacterium]|nr:hypothetical protein [Bacillota bacterium]